MRDTFILYAVIVFTCLATAFIIISAFFGHSSLARLPSGPDEAELQKREYETMLRHRRREKNRREFEENNIL